MGGPVIVVAVDSSADSRQALLWAVSAFGQRQAQAQAQGQGQGQDQGQGQGQGQRQAQGQAQGQGQGQAEAQGQGQAQKPAQAEPATQEATVVPTAAEAEAQGATVVPSAAEAGEQGAEVHLVHVVRPTEGFIPDGPEMRLIPKATPAGASSAVAQGDQLLREAERLWEAEQRRQGLAGAAMSRHLLQGDPRKRIVGLAESVGAEMVVVGRRGLTPWQRTWVGSVSDYCATHCPCPVACIPKAL